MKGIVMTQKRYISLPVLAALCMASGFSHSSSEAVTFESAKETMISAGKRTLNATNFFLQNGLAANIAILAIVSTDKWWRKIPYAPQGGEFSDFMLQGVVAPLLCQVGWNIATRPAPATNRQPREDSKSAQSKIIRMLSCANTALENGGAYLVALPTIFLATSCATYAAVERAHKGLSRLQIANSKAGYYQKIALCASLCIGQPLYNISAHYIRKYWNAHKQNAQTDIENESVQQPTQEPEDNSDAQAAKGTEQATA